MAYITLSDAAIVKAGLMADSPNSRSQPAGAHRAPPTLHDVANRAGVSRQTVSNVVRGTGRLGESTRARVLAAIEELGFTPHHGAASLRSGRVDRFAYLLPKGEPREENTILLDFLQHLVVAAGTRHQQVLVIQPGGHAGRHELAALDDLVRSRSIDAVVLSAVTPTDARVQRLQQLGVPFACFGRTGRSAPQAWVDVDNRAGVRHATQAVIDRGHQAIAFVGYRSSRRWDWEREAGYGDAMARAGLAQRVMLVDGDDPGSPIRRLLRGPNRPTALITGSDVLAAACYAAATQAGCTVGGDLAVVGFDGTVAARLLAPSLATVRIPLARIAEQLVDRLLGKRPNDVGDVLAPELIPGESLSGWPPP